MMKLGSLDEILRFAIRKEADAAAFYKMAEGHKKKLEGFDLKKIGKMQLKEAKGLGMSEMMEDVPYSSDMSYADLLRMAIKNEEKSQQLYLATGKMVTEPSLKKLLL